MPEITLKSTFAALPQVERGRSVRLGGDPKGENFLYCNGNSVYIRNLHKPELVDIYTQHSKPVTVARYSPSRFYICSGDCLGKIRIWDTVNPEHILKAEYPVLGGKISDLDWCNESQRIVVAGDGREKFASVIRMDSGNTLGVISGHGKSINSCSFRKKRPVQIVTASEDMTVVFHDGPPFKFKRTKSEHTNFVNCARFTNNGDFVFSCGSDKKLIRYSIREMDADTEAGKVDETAGVTEIAGHDGGIYELCFSPDDQYVVTVSGDKTARIFDVNTTELKQAFVMGDKKSPWTCMQLGCLWQGDTIITVNGRGHISYLNRENPEKPLRVVKGHMKPVTALAVCPEQRLIFTGGQEGIIYWNADTGDNDEIMGQGHTNEVTDMVIDGDTIISVGVDDTVRFSSVSGKEFFRSSVKLDSQPKGVSALNGITVVASVKHLTVLEGTNKKLSLEYKVAGDATSVSINQSRVGCTIAVGFMDHKVRIYSLQNFEIKEQRMVEMTGEVAAVTYSPDGSYLAVASDRRVSALSTTDYKELSKSENHTARVRHLAWSPDNTRFASTGLDSNIMLWDDVNESFKKRPTIKGHTMSHANKIAWLDANTIVSAGQDSNIKQFTVSD